MNFTDLKAAVLSDAHREDYTAHIDRFVAEAEALIFARLESYGLETTLIDANRVSVLSPVYSLPTKFVEVRQLIYNDLPLDKRDESAIYNLRNAGEVIAYCVRPRTLVVAANTPANASLYLHYWGLPAALVSGTDTNTLLNEYPQLYKRATQISVFERMKDYDAKADAQRDVNALIDEINRKVKKQLGGARASNPYNVRYRSSY